MHLGNCKACGIAIIFHDPKLVEKCKAQLELYYTIHPHSTEKENCGDG